MPLPPVVIELSTADAASPLAPLMMRACSDAVVDGECQGGDSDDATARAVVIVAWDDERRQARIEIGVRRQGKSQWASRKLLFKDSDPEAERWRTVGLVIGTLVGQAERDAQQEAQPPAAAPKPAKIAARPAQPRPEGPPAPRPARMPPRLWIGGELVTGPALDDGTWRIGGAVGVVYDVPEWPMLGSASVRALARPADDRAVEARWLGAALGLGVRHHPIDVLRTEARGELVVERIDASVNGARRDSAGRTTPGARLTLGAGPKLGDWGLVLVSAEFTGIPQGTAISLEGQSIGRAPPLTWSLGVGARLRLY